MIFMYDSIDVIRPMFQTLHRQDLAMQLANQANKAAAQSKPQKDSYGVMVRNKHYTYGMLWINSKKCSLWLFNIAMENGPFIDGLPMKNGWIFPWLR